MKASWPNKKLKKSPPDLLGKEIVAIIVERQERVEKLKREIAELQKVDLSVAKIAAFLLKAQLVETSLKTLIFRIDSQISIFTRSLVIKQRKIFNNKLSDKGLGQLKRLLSNYENRKIVQLIAVLDRFKKKRDDFTHRLFTIDEDLAKLSAVAQELSKSTDRAHKLIDSIMLDISNERLEMLLRKKK